MDSFPQQFRRMRHARGLSQQDVADLFGISQVAVCFWEQGRARPPRPKEVLARLRAIPSARVEDSDIVADARRSQLRELMRLLHASDIVNDAAGACAAVDESTFPGYGVGIKATTSKLSRIGNHLLERSRRIIRELEERGACLPIVRGTPRKGRKPRGR